MRYSALVLSFAIAVAAADSTTTVSYLDAQWESVTNPATIPYYTSVAASVVDINAVETTYAVECLSGAPTTVCSIEDPWTLIQGDTTMTFTGIYTATDDDYAVTVTRDFGCSFISQNDSAYCSYSIGMTGTVGGMDYASTTSDSSTFPSESVGYYMLEVTGGLDKFTSPEATESPGVAAAGPARALITAAPVLAAVAAALI